MSILKHTACHSGKRVKIVMRDKSVVYGKFKDRKKPYIFITMDDGHIERIHTGDVKVFSIFNKHIAGIQHDAI